MYAGCLIIHFILKMSTKRMQGHTCVRHKYEEGTFIKSFLSLLLSMVSSEVFHGNVIAQSDAISLYNLYNYRSSQSVSERRSEKSDGWIRS